MQEYSMIVDQDGKPINKSLLTQEVAHASMTGVRQAYMTDSVASSLTPAMLSSLLQSANEGSDYDYLTLAGEMEEREAHYGSVLGTRRLAVESLPVHVETPEDSGLSDEIVKAVELLVKRPEFEELVSDLLDGLGKGRSTCEIVWDQSGATWEPKEYLWRDPRHFKFHPENPRELRLVDEMDMVNGLELPAYKFITHVPKLRTGIATRSGLARLVSVAYMCKSYTLRDWMAFSELFGMPIRVGKYSAGAQEGDISILRRAVANIGSDAAAVIPESMRIEFIEKAGGSGSGHSLFKDLAEWLDKQISKAVLGQTASAEGTAGKLGGDDAQNEVRQDLLKADAKQLARTINRYLIQPYIDLNFGKQTVYPVVQFFVHEPEDIKGLVDAVDKLAAKGLRVSQNEMRNKLGLTDPEPDDEILNTGAAAPVAEELPQTALNRQQAEPVDEIATDDLEGWEPIMEPLISPIQRLAEESQDEEEFLARLPELLEDMDATELIKSLGTAAFQARGLGDAS